ncbi:MAG TPA: translation factor GTPase family protein [Gaiellaceae bacterium]|nr:translation factor GTPase family protein [Gaiellaceae bacterium]
MARKWLNLGILAHVDAGKTTLTERLLYEAAVIDAVGRVDAGTTQTDTLALERQRGITIKAAVVSFAIGETTVNLIDTPGHPDFIAEVERSLAVLDGAVLVLSAVEGVQPQTRILMRALQRLRLPTLLFVNKLDRNGADVERVLAAVADRLTPDAIPLAGNPGLVEAFGAEIAAGEVYPVLAGSALTGAGVAELMAAIPRLLPAAGGDPAASPDGAVFKIERGRTGEKAAYVRMFAGTVRVRDRLEFGESGDAKVTALAVFERGGARRGGAVAAGQITKLWGLADVRIGDRVGRRGTLSAHEFAAPTLEAVVRPLDAADSHALSLALAQLAEQDPLIGVRQDEGVLCVSLYGEVQKQVIEATLAADYGLAVEFGDTTIVHVERPRGSGEALEILNAPTNPFSAEVGLRIEPGPEDSGVEFRLDVANRWLPLYVYKRRELFEEGMSRYVRAALQAGLRGWRVTDCVVTMTRCDYPSADGPPSKRGSLAMPGDYEGLTPLVLRQALERAGTVVCEPVLRVEIELPPQSVGATMAVLHRLEGSVDPPELTRLVASVPAARINELQRLLPGLTGGEGVLESSFAGHRPVTGEPPRRQGTLPPLRTS